MNLDAIEIIKQFQLKENNKPLLSEKLDKLKSLRDKAVASVELYNKAIYNIEQEMLEVKDSTPLEQQVAIRIQQLENVGLTNKAIIAALCIEFSSKKEAEKHIEIINKPKQEIFNKSKLPSEKMMNDILSAIKLCGTNGIRFEELKNINPFCNMDKAELNNTLRYYIASGKLQTVDRARGMRYMIKPEIEETFKC